MHLFISSVLWEMLSLKTTNCVTCGLIFVGFTEYRNQQLCIESDWRHGDLADTSVT